MPAKSKAQQALMGMALAVRQGKLKRSQVDQNVLDIVDSDMSTKDMEHFASTKRKSLPEYVKEQMDLGTVEFKITYNNQKGITSSDRFTAPYLNALLDNIKSEHPDWEILKIEL